jgi:hypothetical protein
MQVLGEERDLSLYVSRNSPLHSSHLKVEAVINQTPLLTIRWPQCSHSRVRSTYRRPDERVTALSMPVSVARNHSLSKGRPPLHELRSRLRV